MHVKLGDLTGKLTRHHALPQALHIMHFALDQTALVVVTELLSVQPQAAIVFCNQRRDVDEIAAHLVQQGFAAAGLHGDMEQRDREQTLQALVRQALAQINQGKIKSRQFKARLVQG